MYVCLIFILCLFLGALGSDGFIRRDKCVKREVDEAKEKRFSFLAVISVVLLVMVVMMFISFCSYLFGHTVWFG